MENCRINWIASFIWIAKRDEAESMIDGEDSFANVEWRANTD